MSLDISYKFGENEREEEVFSTLLKFTAFSGETALSKTNIVFIAPPGDNLVSQERLCQHCFFRWHWGAFLFLLFWKNPVTQEI